VVADLPSHHAGPLTTPKKRRSSSYWPSLRRSDCCGENQRETFRFSADVLPLVGNFLVFDNLTLIETGEAGFLDSRATSTIKLTAVGGNFTRGSVRVAIQYILCGTPMS
jgi:hypothetical protein